MNPAVSQHHPIPWPMLQGLMRRGLPPAMLPQMVNLCVIDGNIAFYEHLDDDLVLWDPSTDRLSTRRRRAFALGASDNLSAAAGALVPLRIHAGPLDWLRAGGRGLVIINYLHLFDRLRDVAQVEVAEAVLPMYRAAMRPRQPELAVISGTRVPA